MPNGPGAVLWPNSKTRRSNPGWCATRTATSWAWLLAFPPVVRGHTDAGDDPALAVGVGVTLGEALGRAVATAVDEAGVEGLADREADTVGVGVGEELVPG
jgi:hypothetical protein